MQRFKSPRGTHDVLPDETRKWQWIKGVARIVLRRYGYREIQTPLIEDAGLFLKGVGEASDIAVKEMYAFKDRRGRDLALRPEGTASVVRAYIQHHMHTDREIQKLYYFGPMFRYDRPQAGRNRQFFQIGSEAIGSQSPFLDIETILLWNEFFNQLGLSDLSILLNSVGCKECRPGYQEAIREALSAVKGELCSDCRERYEKNPLRILDCKVESCRGFRGSIPLITEHLCVACSEHHAHVRSYIEDAGCAFIDDPFLVRGLDYYTRTAFEFVHGQLGAQNSLGGGGRYDDLIASLGGGDVPAVGFSAGLERILLALESEDVELEEDDWSEGNLDLFLIYTGQEARDEAFRQMIGLRRHLRVDIDFMGKSVKAQFRMADRLGVPRVLIFGSDELERGTVIVRDMLKGDEREVRLEHLEKEVREETVD